MIFSGYAFGEKITYQGADITYQAATAKLSQGEKLFKENKSKEAAQVLENEILNGQISANTYNFLGLAYYQLGEYGKSVDAFDRGIKAQPTNTKILAFNKGNSYYAMKDYTSAVSAYSQSLADDEKFYDALLNRANSLLMANQLKNAKNDYEKFIEKCPQNEQKGKIEALIRALSDELARREEEARILAEQNKAKWEKIDPSINENQLVDNTVWELVDDLMEDGESIAEKDGEKEIKEDWQKFDAVIVETQEPEKKDWQAVESRISENTIERQDDWEKIENQSSKEFSLTSDDDKDGDNSDDAGELADNNEDPSNINEEFELVDEKLGDENFSDKKNEDSIPLVENWENLSDEDASEIKRVERESRKEYEKWLEEQILLRQEREAEKIKKAQEKNGYDDENPPASREEILQELREAEEARKKKLLDDVVNSLQNSDSTNMTSGADDLIEYDQEGKLD